MNISNLAQRLDEFAATMNSLDAPEEKAPRLFAVAAPPLPRRPLRRLSLGTHRIQTRDSGLRHFRVF